MLVSSGNLIPRRGVGKRYIFGGGVRILNWRVDERSKRGVGKFSCGVINSIELKFGVELDFELSLLLEHVIWN